VPDFVQNGLQLQLNQTLAKWRLGVHEKVIRRMLDPEHVTKTATIQAALAALGKRLTGEIRDAA
jgi:hypothetical protein